MFNRLSYIRPLLKRSGLICVTIDDYELYNLKNLMDSSFGVDNFLANVIIRNNPSGRSTVTGFAINHEYALFYSRLKSDCIVGRLPHTTEQRERYDITDESGRTFEWENFRKNSSGSYRNDRPKQFYPILINKQKNTIRVPQLIWNDSSRAWDMNDTVSDDETVVYPIDEQGRERVWRYGVERAANEIYTMRFTEKNGTLEIYKRKYFQEAGSLPRTWWDKADYSARDNGTRSIVNILGEGQAFEFPKAIGAVMDCLKVINCDSEAIAFDCFAGSGTTANAVINLNREDDGNRKYILVEMGEYFDTVTKPRIQKVIYSEDWKDGKPVSRKGSSHTFKYIRLESYEDTLNNIEIEDSALKFITNPAVKEQYMLHYLFPVETKGSVSLLNIDLLEHPFDYGMNITRKQESKMTNIDLVETFNYLIGLKVERSYAPQSFDAEFTTGEYGVVTARLKSGNTYRFKMVEGTTNSGDRTLIIWRDMTGDKIKDNAALDAFFERKKISITNFEYKKIYVNGDNNLPNLRAGDESWKVILIEEELKKRIFSTENV